MFSHWQLLLYDVVRILHGLSTILLSLRRKKLFHGLCCTLIDEHLQEKRQEYESEEEGRRRKRRENITSCERNIDEESIEILSSYTSDNQRQEDEKIIEFSLRLMNHTQFNRRHEDDSTQYTCEKLDNVFSLTWCPDRRSCSTIRSEHDTRTGTSPINCS